MAVFAILPSWINDYSDFILLSLIPTIITGLTVAPKTRGAITWVRAFAAFFSIVTHRDEPGTFKLPLTAKLPPNGVNHGNSTSDVTDGVVKNGTDESDK